MRNKRNSRQITVLRSLFRTLHPILESGLAPARRLLTGNQDEGAEQSPPHAAKPNRAQRTDTGATPTNQANVDNTTSSKIPPRARPKAPPIRTLTDEHLVVELENITRQISQHGHTAHPQPGRRASPQRGTRHYSRDTLLALLEEAKVRIQVLETELELARGHEETIPMLTDEWSDEWLDETAANTGKPEQQN